MNAIKETRLPRAIEESSQWHRDSAAETESRLKVDPAIGLDETEVRRRLAQFGPNRIREEKQEAIWQVFLDELREPLILLLIFTGILYAVWGEFTDALTIFFVILTLNTIEVWNEYRAHQAIAALRKLAAPTTTVRRSGQVAEIPSEQIVPGDVLLIDAGKHVSADARLIESYSLAVDESSLTGESVPVDKQAESTLPPDTPLADRSNMVYAGTAVTRGRGAALAVATGETTELGRIAAITREVESPRTPLQHSMRELSRSLVGLAIGFSVIVPVLGWLLTTEPLPQLILTGLSLAFATIPEEMPIIITMTLALGAYRLSQHRAIAKHLKAVETLGAVTVIATDKTGTLTENRMEVSAFSPADQRKRALEIAALAGDASSEDEVRAEPMEKALLRAAREEAINVPGVQQANPTRAEFTFDNRRKLMSIVHEHLGQLWVAVKGAPESVLARSTRRLSGASEVTLTAAEREQVLAEAGRMAENGLRVLALADKSLPDASFDMQQVESDLTFVSLVGLADPPRPETKAAIAATRQAGIRPIMITGDHPLTARAIARQVGLDGSGRVLTGPELDALSTEELRREVGQVSIYARTTPEQKLRIVQAMRENGERVAVTGDGVNDAPALAAADIGVAMGETGTDVAREAADLILADDNYATIVRAIEEGRILFANLRKAVRYYLSVKVALVSATLLPVLLRVPVPFAPVQIILMELFMDLAASATFVAEPPEAGLMQRPPRDPAGNFMDRAMLVSILTSALGLFAAVSVAYLVTYYSGAGLGTAQTVAFVTWLLGHVLLALNMRSEREPLFRIGFFSNRLMVLWAAATVVFVLFVTLLPGVQGAVKTTPLTSAEWLLILAAALAGAFWMELRKLLGLDLPYL